MPNWRSLADRVARAAIRSLFPVLLTGLAASLGYFYAIVEIRHKIQESHVADTLGNLLGGERHRLAVASAYADPKAALGELDRISWAIPSVMTPFVGAAPSPGQHPSAFITPRQFRGPKGPADPKPARRVRLFLTGGSVALSAGAPDDERTIGAYLERALSEALAPGSRRSYEVFTLAAPSWSSSHERVAIENLLSELEPDLVISLSGVNDVFYAEQGADVLWSRSLPEQFFWQLANASYVAAGRTPMVDVAAATGRVVPPQRVGQRIAKNARLAAFALSLRGARYEFFLQPSIVTTGKPLTSFEGELVRRHIGFRDLAYHRSCYEEMDAQLSRVASAAGNNFRYHDLGPVFDHLGDQDALFIDSYHFGDRGNEIIARAIFESLREIL